MVNVATWPAAVLGGRVANTREMQNARMGMLALRPWLDLREPLRAEPFHLIPYWPGQGVPAEVSCSVSPEDMRSIVSPYRACVQHRLANLALLQYEGRAIGADFTP